MTADVELLPLPDKVEVDKHLPTGVRIYAYDADTLRTYARANVLHHTAPLRYALDNAAREIKTLRGVRDAQAAEIEALRAEVERLTGCLATANANHEQFERQWSLERDRAERLAEAGRRVTAAFRAHGEASAMLSLADAIEAASG